MASLITLSSPIAVMLPTGDTRQVNVVQAEVKDVGSGELLLIVSKYYDSGSQTMKFVRASDAYAPCPRAFVEVRIKATNVRSKQEVA